MIYGKDQRMKAMAAMIRGRALSSQDEVADALAAEGFAVTQATVSRDLERLGAVKARRDGQLRYVLPGEPGSGERVPPRVAAVLRDWVLSVEPAANLVIIKTPPGSAHLVGVALDADPPQGLLGTICGDDTIFGACAGAAEAKELAGRLRPATR